MNKKESKVVELLSKGTRMYGLDLVKQSDGVLKRGGVYFTLVKMEDDGLVRAEMSSEERRKGAIARRMYSLTRDGEKLIPFAKGTETLTA